MTSITQTSPDLYCYLCQHVVVTEQTVKTKRLLNIVNDCCAGRYYFTSIICGSFGEGLEMKGSDIDQMFVIKHIIVHESMDFKFNPDITNFVMNTEGTKPGFTKLKLSSIDVYRFSNLNLGKCTPRGIFGKCINIGNDFYLSNDLFMKTFLKRSYKMHGPCVSDQHGQFDFAFCFKSKSWITPASHWLQRAYNGWPCQDVKAKVVEYGVLFEPIGVKGSNNEEFEWLISFSVGEKLLIYSFNHTQLLCYALVKILLKDITENYSRCKTALCLYYTKTILFWVSEELPLSLWTPENLIPCFLRCFRRLIYCVEYSICPHYFIPENNMFEDRIEGFIRSVLLENLSVLYSYGWKCLLMSQQMSQFDPSIRSKFQLFQESVKNIINSRAFYNSQYVYQVSKRKIETPAPKSIKFLKNHPDVKTLPFEVEIRFSSFQQSIRDLMYSEVYDGHNSHCRK